MNNILNDKDEYENDIEENFENQISIKTNQIFNSFIKTAKSHIKNKKSITIRLPTQDIEIMKIKASKLGIAYQTYINMLIHLDATKL